MKKSELFALILSIVSDVTEVSSQEILSKSIAEEIVEARMLLIHFCYREGLLPSKIAALAGLSHRCVNKYISKANSLISNGGGYSNNQLKFYCETVAFKLGTVRESVRYPSGTM